MAKKIILFVCALFLCAAPLYADSITLKSGQQVEGTIVERADRYIKIEAFGVAATYFIEDIERVNGQALTQASIPPLPIDEAAVAAELPAQEEQVVAEEPAAVEEPVVAEENFAAEEQMPIREDQPAEQYTPVQVREDRTSAPALPLKGMTRAQTKQALIIGSAIFGFLLIVGLIAYIYSSFCLYLIAKKTGQGPAWWAWVPIANAFLMCKIASLSYWWLLGFFAGLIPYIGILASLLLSGYFWYRMALARNKPGWVGILVCIPLAGLVIMGYLAFSE